MTLEPAVFHVRTSGLKPWWSDVSKAEPARAWLMSCEPHRWGVPSARPVVGGAGA